MSELDTLQTQLLEQVESAATLADLDAVRVSVLGKKGVITEKMKSLGAMAPEERKAADQKRFGRRDRSEKSQIGRG